MKKNARKLNLNRESIRNLTALETVVGGAAKPVTSVNVGCTTEYTWYCPSASGCSNCPVCNEP